VTKLSEYLRISEAAEYLGVSPIWLTQVAFGFVPLGLVFLVCLESQKGTFCFFE
jgi:hypothetical protein